MSADAMEPFMPSTEPEGFISFMLSRVGPDWVVARKTARLVEKYGSAAVFISQSRYRRLSHEYFMSLPRPPLGTESR